MNNLNESFIPEKSTMTEKTAITPSKGCKRKNQDSPMSSSKKKNFKTTNELLQSELNEKCESDIKSSSKEDVNVDPEELHNILEGMEDEIDNALEQAASKNKLSRTNVKNILKHVITNEYVLAMVRNTMKIESGEGELEEAVFEPKLTRSKIKELQEKQHAFIKNIGVPVPSPMKNGDQVAQQLLQEEFLDESSDDEDYKPNEEEEPSDDDETVTSPRASELWSPKTPTADPSSPVVEKVLEHYADDENALVIELPDLNPPSVQSVQSEVDKIALRTRSKLCLNDTPLEEIEASFFAPDFTIDMYDTAVCEDDDDWLKFLSDLSKPIGTNVMTGHVGEVDNSENDPEYYVKEEEEDEDQTDPFESRYDPVPRKEFKALMADIFEFAQQECMVGEDEEEEESSVSNQTLESVFTSTDINCVETRSEWINSDEKLQLDEQMRMYVQLLTQAYLLSYGTADLRFLNISAKLFLDELKLFATRGVVGNKKSAFHAYNLDNALKIINKYEKQTAYSNIQVKVSAQNTCPVPTFAKRTIATSKVFIYPELLPTCGIPPPYQLRKAVFTSAEDNLIAIGLEQFATCDSKIDAIQSLLVPSKTRSQIKVRMKNCNSSKVGLDNPIKYYHVHKVAPQYPRIVRIFDPDKIKIPAEFPLDVLPKWMTFYCRVASGNPMFVPPPIAPLLQPPPLPKPKPAPLPASPVAVVRPMFRKMPERRKSRLILPLGAVFSPLKQITPILKKYSFSKKPITVLPFTIVCPLKDKCGRFANKFCSDCTQLQKSTKPREIKPKPAPETDVCIDTPTKQCNPVNLLPNSSGIQVNQVMTNEQAYTTVVQPIYVNTATSVSSSNSFINDEIIESSINDPSIQSINMNSQITPESILPIDISPSSELSSPALSTTAKESSSDANSKDKIMNIDEDNENIDEDEPDLPAIATVSAKKQPVSKKKNRIHRDLESSLALLKPTMVNNDPKKEEREILYVNSYLLRASEYLKSEPETWNLFLSSICKYQHCTKFPVKLYLELKIILKNHPALLDDFVAFMKPAEAKLVGKFKQYLVLNKIREFLRKIEVHFSNQPHVVPRIVRALSQFRQQSYVTSAEALSGLQPLLRNQTHLMEELLQLIPDAAVPLYLQTDFEDINVPNSDEDVSSSGSWENITIPDAPDPYGGKDCPCSCHSESADNRLLNKSRHCVKCGVKFIDGRIYLQTGKVLKPAQVNYHEMPCETNDKNKNSQKPSSKALLPHESLLKALAAESFLKQGAITDKKDTPKSTTSSTKSIQQNTNESLPTTSKLPCDVIEDTVFPTVISNSNKSIPSDFSHLRDMIGISKDTSTISASSESDEISASIQKRKWTREEDKLIIYNCQRLGIRKEAFLTTANTIKSRSAEEVEDRFFSMVEMVFKTASKQQL